MCYSEVVKQEAKEFLEENKQDIIKAIKEEEVISFNELEDSLNLYDLTFEWVDSSFYSILRASCFDNFKTEFQTCAFIIEEAGEKETDKGLWEGQDTEKAVFSQAFFSFLNDFRAEVENLINELIEEVDENENN